MNEIRDIRTVGDIEGIDPEVIKLCDAMNGFEGIQTIESCCGHGKEKYRVWFVADDLESLPELLYWFDGCHTSWYGWSVTVHTDCAASPAVFMVEGPVGAFLEADGIAAMMMEDTDEWRRLMAEEMKPGPCGHCGAEIAEGNALCASDGHYCIDKDCYHASPRCEWDGKVLRDFDPLRFCSPECHDELERVRACV